jgi:hypothetical protein
MAPATGIGLHDQLKLTGMALRPGGLAGFSLKWLHNDDPGLDRVNHGY